MQCYTELIPPTAVSHAVALPFLDSKAINLVVAKTSLLQVFRLHDIATDDTHNGQHTPSATTPKLVLIGEYPLAGTVTSLAAIKTPDTKSGGDALLVAFKDAKLSLIEWDTENHRIGTTSIHYYEGDNVTTVPFGPSLGESETVLTIDPSSRCAALKFGARSLAILPFRQAEDELIGGGEDGYDPDLDIAPPSAPLKRTQSGLNEGSSSEAKQTPYKSSFVLPLTALDPTLMHPVHLCFLHEYREPTFGILSAPVQPSSALLEERKDILSYSIFTLDLEQRASTNLSTVQKLPSDLWKVLPLPLPVGGALLVGTNELIHVDQGGRTNAVAVNEFAKIASNFGMADASNLNMKLEDCEIIPLDPKSGDLLMVLNDGSLAILTFRLLGRSVGGLNVSRVTAENGISLVEATPSCVASLNGSRLFIGSEVGDSTLLGWTKSTANLSRKRSHAEMIGSEDADEIGDDVDEDDLYAPTTQTTKQMESLSTTSQIDAASSYNFEMLDTLPSLAPFNATCFGRTQAPSKDKLELVAAVGRGRGSRLAFVEKEIVPNVLGSTAFANAQNAWTLRTKRNDGKSQEDFDNLLCMYDGERSRLYDILDSPTHEPVDGNLYSERKGTDFEHDGETLSISTLVNGSWIVHCRLNEIRSYDAADLSLSQITPMINEETDAELKIVHTSFCDPYLLVIRDDSSLLILKADKSGEIEPLEAVDEVVRDTKWLSGCLYHGSLCGGETAAFLLGEDGGLHVLSLPQMKVVYSIPTLPYLPAILSPEAAPRRMGAKETLTEILVAEMGVGSIKQPYLILRTALDDLTLYEAFKGSVESWESSTRFRKVPFHYLPTFDEASAEENDGRPAPLRSMTLGDRSVVYVHGSKPTFIIKEPSSHPKAIGVEASSTKALAPLHHASCRQGFALIDAQGNLKECQMPSGREYSTGWAVWKIALGDAVEEVRHVAFHDDRGMYVIATCRDVDFYFPEDDGRHLEQDDITLRPQVPRYTLHLLSAKTRTIIHSLEMPALDTITSLKIVPLEISEQTHDQKLMIAVGTSVQRGEDMPAKGGITVLDIRQVVPDPARPESENKLHITAREDTKGAVTAVDWFPGGLIGTAQGQKIMVRGLKEDGSCLPVAFLDVQCYTTQLKSLGKSGMFLAADAWKGVWFGGFTEEPYKISVLGKSRTKMEVVAAQFLPFDGQLFLMVLDAQMDLHVLQYDPENPKSLSGTRLVHRSTMHIGHFGSEMLLVPSTLAPMADQTMTNGHHANGDDDNETPAQDNALQLSHVLMTTMTGAVGLLTPVDEATYRRLGSIQTHLTSVLEHAAGLNPRAYRAVESEGFGSRGIIDGSLVQRISELGSARRSEVLGRAGADAWALRSDLEVIGGGGLGYL